MLSGCSGNMKAKPDVNTQLDILPPAATQSSCAPKTHHAVTISLDRVISLEQTTSRPEIEKSGKYGNPPWEFRQQSSDCREHTVPCKQNAGDKGVPGPGSSEALGEVEQSPAWPQLCR